jgi:cytosine deaminase
MAVHLAHMTSLADMARLFTAVTDNGARAMAIADYGLKIGGPADLVVLDARDTIEAIRLRPPRLSVIKAGRVISESAPRQSMLKLDGRPGSVEPASYARRLG